MSGHEVIEGTCALCGQEMLQDTKTLDTWHPWDVGQACPPEPDVDPDDLTAYSRAWTEFYEQGLRSGRPGVQHFRPDAG